MKRSIAEGFFQEEDFGEFLRPASASVVRELCHKANAILRDWAASLPSVFQYEGTTTWINFRQVLGRRNHGNRYRTGYTQRARLCEFEQLKRDNSDSP